MTKVSILIVEDEILIRQGLRSLLSKEEFVKEIVESGNAREALDVLNALKIDIVLLDMRLHGKRGQEILPDILKHYQSPKVIVVTGLEGVELVVNLLKGGVHSIVFKLDGYQEIVRSIHGVLEKGYYFQEKITRLIQSNAHRWESIPPVTLSYQEMEVLQLIATGVTTKEMSGILKMTEATTETYRTRLIKKLGVPNTAALLAYAFRNGLL